MIGSNGAGKTTLFQAICGLLGGHAARCASTAAHHGATGAPDRPPRAGLRAGRAHLFPQMTVDENLDLGAYPRRPEAARRALVFDLFPRLAERRRQEPER